MKTKTYPRARVRKLTWGTGHPWRPWEVRLIRDSHVSPEGLLWGRYPTVEAGWRAAQDLLERVSQR